MPYYRKVCSKMLRGIMFCFETLRPLTNYNDCAGTECFSHVVEGFTCVGTSIFGEYFRDFEGIFIIFLKIIEVLGWFYFLVIVQPDYVKLGSASNLARKHDGGSVLNVLRLEVVQNSRHAVSTFAVSLGCLFHGQDSERAPTVDGTQRIGRLALIKSLILGENFVDRQTGLSLFVLEVHYVR